MTEPIQDEHSTAPKASPDAIDASHAPSMYVTAQERIVTDAASWYVRYQDGLNQVEETHFQAWLAQDPAHEAAFARMTRMWERLGTLPDEDVSRLKADIAPSTVATRPPQARKETRRWWLNNIASMVPRMAIAGIALTIVGSSWFGWHYWQNQPVFSQTYATVRGQQLAVSLPDGSQLTLDTDTHTEVRLYKNRREVRLREGQAMFTVKADASQPFDVLAKSMRITVVGTRFSVRHTQTGLNPDGVSVNVEEGRVRVTPKTAPTVELTAGDAITSDASGRLTHIAKNASGGPIVWREGRVNFDRTPLAHALAEFERYGAPHIAINDAAVNAMRINGSFDLHQANTFINSLIQVLPIRLAERNGISELVPIR